MRKNEQGFAALAALILAMVVMVVVGGGYYVLKNQNKDTNASTASVEAIQKKPVIKANGTPESVVKEVNQQLNTEISIEDDGADQETQQSSMNSTSLNKVQESIDASKL